MKRKHTLILFLLFTMFVNAQQTYKVSTSEEKQNILLEEFTGVHCSFCPIGHNIAASLYHGLKDQLCIVNIHAGPFAKAGKNSNLTSEDGDSLYNYYVPNDFPSAMINRHAFEDGLYIYTRDSWFYYVTSLKDQTAKVNLHLESAYNGDDRSLTIHVEGYNYSDNGNSDMKLYVLLTQDHIKALQLDVNNTTSYNHMRVLTDYITPYTGEVINNKNKGEFFTADYTYQVPEKFNEKDFIPGNMNVVAYVTSEGMNEVLNVISCKPEIKNLKDKVAAELSAPDLLPENEYAFNFFEGKILNQHNDRISNATFEINVNGETYTSEAVCDIAPYMEGTVNIPCHYTYDATDSVKYDVTLTAINGVSVTPTSISGAFTKPVATGPNVTVKILTDKSTNENEYCIKDEDGNVVRKFGPYAPKKSVTYEEKLTLESDKYYCIEVTDIYGNGIMSGKKASIAVYDEAGKCVKEICPIFGFGTRLFFKVDGSLGIDDITAVDNNEGQAYSINGMAVDANNTSERIIIRNGKKYINKR